MMDQITTTALTNRWDNSRLDKSGLGNIKRDSVNCNATNNDN